MYRLPDQCRLDFTAYILYETAKNERPHYRAFCWPHSAKAERTEKESTSVGV
jgi:hypothetical protein